MNWIGSGANFEYSNSNETSVVFTSGNATVTANLKGTEISTNLNAYSTNSQRKAVRTQNGHLHKVYESLGLVWYEKSTDNGTTWTIENNGKPLSTNESKLPSIDIPDNTSNAVAIVWQEKNGNSYKIKLAYNTHPTWYLSFWVVYDELETFIPDPYSFDAMPVVGWGNNQLFVCWKKKDYSAGLKYRYGIVSPYFPPDWKTSGYYGNISGTNSNSTNPTITVKKVSGSVVFHLGWQESNSIKYCSITPNTEHQLNITGTETASTLSPYSVNQFPSISLANGKPIISWTGSSNFSDTKMLPKENLLGISKTVVRIKGPSGWSDFQIAGDNVNYTNNNSVTAASEKTVIVWSEGTTPQTKWMRRTSGSYNTPANLSHSGIQTQIISGYDYNNMTSLVFSTSQTPYYFTKSTTNFSGLDQRLIAKIEDLSDTVITFGRAGIVNINGVEFVFNTGDIIVDNSIIEFIDKPDTLVYTTDDELNQYTKSNTFELNSSSGFYFSNLYYVNNKEAASSLTENDNVNFKIELVKAGSSQVVGTFDNIDYNINSLDKDSNVYYEVNCSGIETGEYYLRLVTTVNSEVPEYALANIMNETSDLNKMKFTQVGFSGNDQPITYELFQNYPNPFNPTTTIRYQVPEDGLVSLKIYDILGKEVRTLVNDQKTTGKYEINFDASDLASGVYIYRIQVNDFVSSKKMLMIK